MSETASAPVVCPAGHGPAPMDLPLKLAIARACNGISPASLAQAGSDWAVHLLASPSKRADLASSAVRGAAQWWHYALTSARGATCDDCVSPRAQDKRFIRPEWDWFPWNTVAQAFLLQERWWDEATHGVRGVSKHHEDVASFVARQWLDMMSPSNFVATNPRVLVETARTGGMNLVEGFSNWLHDANALATGAKPRGVEQFRPGESVALTPGRVVMRNHLAELIQYDAATPRVGKEPVFIVPSWIMKFYILDLTPDDSLVKYLVSQGHTVFMVSWRNPFGDDAGLGMEDYLRQGVLEPLAAVRELCPGTKVHAMGYCLGGTLMAIAAAVLAARKDDSLRTVSLLAAQADFEEPGELGLFMDESQVSFLEDVMAEHGYLDGVKMAGAFQLINSKDLVWSKLVHEYLMGGTTPMTAMKAWNADATRMPARMHAEYLRELYLENNLAEGKYRVAGEAVDLSRIRVPMYVVATERDHVSPWKSVYRIHHLVHAPVDFVLASGGHNVGIVSPASGPGASAEAGYRTAPATREGARLEDQRWFEASTKVAGSWWPHWHRWLHGHSTGTLRARAVRPLLPPGESAPAPGTYVFQD